MDKVADDKDGFLIDGFPEYLDQAILFEKNIMDCKKVLYIECSGKIIIIIIIKKKKKKKKKK